MNVCLFLSIKNNILCSVTRLVIQLVTTHSPPLTVLKVFYRMSRSRDEIMSSAGKSHSQWSVSICHAPVLPCPAHQPHSFCCCCLFTRLVPYLDERNIELVDTNQIEHHQHTKIPHTHTTFPLLLLYISKLNASREKKRSLLSIYCSQLVSYHLLESIGLKYHHLTLSLSLLSSTTSTFLPYSLTPIYIFTRNK